MFGRILNAEAVTGMRSVKKFFLKILQNSQETPVPDSLFSKVTGLSPATLLKKRLAVVFL